ncbi:alcohol dehydrogenase [Pseudonocardia sp. C8]|uniref:alcohol dehydrogenase n=1 Tax=Pseudonocardia sp. C8 TaxID=2762759 RepID=UPI002102A039|nr:alcohol dehydrogenase [Pseudonocardia sp. C8]
MDLPTPRATENAVVLKVLRSGVCHTDTHLRQGAYDLGSRGSLRLVDRGVTYPLVMGHEVVGVVDQVGDQVESHRPGDVRLVYPWIGCGECRHCREGRDNHCPSGQNLGVVRHGGYAQQIFVPHEKYLVDISGLDLSWAATLACSGLTAYSAVTKVLPLPPGEPIVVIGAGGVGLTAVATLKALGHQAICAVDVSEANLDLAVQLGASATVLSAGDSVSSDIVRECRGPAAAVIDFVNNSSTATAGFDSLQKAGHLVQVGLYGGELVLPNALMALKMLTIRGSFVGSLDQLRSLVELAKSGGLPQTPILHEELNEVAVQTSLDRLAQGGVPGRIVLSAPDNC